MLGPLRFKAGEVHIPTVWPLTVPLLKGLLAAFQRVLTSISGFVAFWAPFIHKGSSGLSSRPDGLVAAPMIWLLL